LQVRDGGAEFVARDSLRDDPFGQLFNDHSIDAQMGALFGRYIAEDRRDSPLACARRDAEQLLCQKGSLVCR
jgi:hypothetical protein